MVFRTGKSSDKAHKKFKLDSAIKNLTKARKVIAEESLIYKNADLLWNVAYYLEEISGSNFKEQYSWLNDPTKITIIEMSKAIKVFEKEIEKHKEELYEDR